MIFFWFRRLNMLLLLMPSLILAQSKEFQKYQTQFIRSKISAHDYWRWLETQNQSDPDIMRMKAHILARANYPYVAALYSGESLQRSSKPLENRHTWALLSSMNRKVTIPHLLQRLALKYPPSDKQTPNSFEKNWHYYHGLALDTQGNAKKALIELAKLQLADRYYLNAQYASAMIYVEQKDYDKAEASLRAMLAASAQKLSPLPDRMVRDLNNYAKLALARIYYARKDFKKSILFYRAVDKGTRLYYDSLFEQSWAFFLGGYPTHALGALHAVESPFFKERFNPESPILRAMIFYWMCRYQDSQAALAEFALKHSDTVGAIRKFVGSGQVNTRRAYQMFEDYLSGVSTSSLGVPRQVLGTAAMSEAMVLLRDQYASVVGELNRLRADDVLGNKVTMKILSDEEQYLKDAIGSQFVVELNKLKSHSDRLSEQSDFLYVELLMSEKEQLLGRELHGEQKLSQLSDKESVIGWASRSQSWSARQRNEFWWDELGYYIYDVTPLCRGD
jgi:tetratricopeptide (TPR) repeat protein